MAQQPPHTSATSQKPKLFYAHIITVREPSLAGCMVLAVRARQPSMTSQEPTLRRMGKDGLCTRLQGSAVHRVPRTQFCSCAFCSALQRLELLQQPVLHDAGATVEGALHSLNKSVPSAWSAAIVSPGGRRQPQQPVGDGLPVPRRQKLRGTGLRDQGCGPGAGRQQRFVQAAGRGLGEQLRLGRLGRLGGNSHSILENTTTVRNVYASRL